MFVHTFGVCVLRVCYLVQTKNFFIDHILQPKFDEFNSNKMFRMQDDVINVCGSNVDSGRGKWKYFMIKTIALLEKPNLQKMTLFRVFHCLFFLLEVNTFSLFCSPFLTKPGQIFNTKTSHNFSYKVTLFIFCSL
jgi:hypothetical protein